MDSGHWLINFRRKEVKMLKVREKLVVLYLEYLEKDVEIVHQRLLDDLGSPVSLDWAASEWEFHKCINSKQYDVILADHTLPGFSAEAALKIALSQCPQTPFICICGTTGEDIAVELLKQGATDYVLKDRLGRLSYAVKRAVHQAEEKAEHEESRRARDKALHEAYVLQENEHKYLEILDGSTEGSWIYDCQKDTIELSSQCLALIGAENVPTNEQFRYVGDLVNRENVQLAMEQWEIVVGKKLPKYKVECKLKTIDKWVLAQGKIIYDKNAVPIKIYGTIMDITDRKLAEEALRRSESLLSSIIEGTSDPIFLKDRYSTFLMANSATGQAVGLPVGMIPGKTDLEIYRDKEKAKVIIETDKRIMEADKADVVEEAIPTPDGIRTYLSAKVPWHDSNGNVIGLIGVARDITARKVMEEELKTTVEELDRKNKLITEFFTNISHEFKTPLSVILMQLELMNLYKDNEVKMKGLIAAATQNSFRLSRLVGNLLDISKIDAGFMGARLVLTDMITLIRNICEMVESYVSMKSISFSFTSSIGSKLMPTDIEKIERIMLNLLSNAIKNTAKEGKIMVCVKQRKAGGVMICVEDNGVGIPKEKQKTIFDRFAQVDTSLNRENDGCGIGLALVKSLVELLKGKISVKSELGKGSKFKVELPLIEFDPKVKAIDIRAFNLKKKTEMELSDLFLKM